MTVIKCVPGLGEETEGTGCEREEEKGGGGKTKSRNILSHHLFCSHFCISSNIFNLLVINLVNLLCNRQ